MSLQKTSGNIHLTALGAMMLSFLLVGCDDSVAQNAAPPAPTVSAAKVLVKSISQWDSFNGRIEAVESVQLRPRVSGYIDKVNYTDGRGGEKGPVLFTIDDRTYRAALEQAQAALARAKTQASLAQSEANRTDKLVHTNLVSREEWEQRRSAAVQAQADIRAAQAAVDAAQLNLDFTKVTAPIDGRASRALITSGNPGHRGRHRQRAHHPRSRKRRCTSTLTSTSQPTSTIKTSPAAGKARPAIIRRSRWRLASVGEEGYPHRGQSGFSR